MKNNFDYEITCYKDKNNQLGGKLYITDDLYIDFDEDAIYKNSKPVNYSPKDMHSLKEIIANHPATLSRDVLAQIHFGNKYFEKDDINRELSNFKYRTNKVTNNILTFKNQCFGVKLEKKIKKFDDKEKRDIYSIRELFPEAYETRKNSDKKVLTSTVFSQKFLHSGAQKLFDVSGDIVLTELSNLSTIFNHISTVDNNSTTQEDVIRYLYEIVIDGCYNNSVKDILKIKGPLGSYKNRIMQYLYLAITKNNEDILPFYIDIAFYERIEESNIQVAEDEIIAQIDKDFDDIQNFINEDKNRTPLLFLDGIRDFSRGNESLYSRISKRIVELDCKLVICLDTDFTANIQHCFNIHPLGANDFIHFMRISSMSLHKKEDSIDFIKNCIDVSNYQLPKDISAEKIYNNLIRLKFSEIDAYWLIYMLKIVFKYIIDTKSNIVDLYTAICIDVLGNAKLLDSSSELAYEFEFESGCLDDSNLNYDIRWRLIRKHRSVLDFLIAKQYAKKMTSLNITKEKTSQNIQQLNIFDMIIQGNIYRFAEAILSKDDNYEQQIMRIAKGYYDELSLVGKSELTFRMTALKNSRRKQDCVRLIKNYAKTEMAFYRSIEADDFEAKKDSAFLLRSLLINLIYENNRDAFIYYFNLLLTDKMANSINRGFHLEYYGDKAYIPNKSLLDFEDDVTKGKKTFGILCLTLNERMTQCENLVFAAAIEVVTLCSLIQARIEQNQKNNVFNVKPYINDCLTYLKWIVTQPQINDLTDVSMYFTWMCNELSEVLDETSCETNETIKYYHSTPFNKFSIAKGVERAGWINSAIPEPENIVEHMYNCCLIGMLYLPDEYPEDGYTKNSVIQMLLIHDLVEAKTGNINRPERAQKQKEYDNQENMAMLSLLFSGTYPGSVDLSTYIEYWKKWNRKEGINYYIAKDIDNIQTIYQFCHYYNQYPGKFTTDDVCYWLSGVNRLESELGKEISEKLIKNNPLYSNIVKLFNQNCNDAY